MRHSVKEHDEICLRTHDNFILAALEVILAKFPAHVVIGDAPVQGCRWEKMVSEKKNLLMKLRLFQKTTYTCRTLKISDE